MARLCQLALALLHFPLLQLAEGAERSLADAGRPALLEAALAAACRSDGSCPADWDCEGDGDCWLALAHRRTARIYAGSALTWEDNSSLTQGSADPSSVLVRFVLHPSGNTAEHKQPGPRSLHNKRRKNRAEGNETYIPGARFHHSTHAIQIAIPVGALLLGALLALTRFWPVGIIVGYFGAQSGLSLYMKLVLSDTTVSQELKLKGVPAAFLITGVQQLVAFVAVSFIFVMSALTKWRTTPKRLTSAAEFGTVLALSLAFAGNIGLNNFSLSLMAISLNLVLRSCLPLVTLAIQSLISIFRPGFFPKVRVQEIGIMCLGVGCAGLATLSELRASKDPIESEHVLLGVLLCTISICSGSLDLILGKILGKQMGVSALDTAWYMSLPTALALLPPGLLLHHPAADWPAKPTDLQVLRRAFSLNHVTLVLVLLSGVFSVSYNVLRYALVQHFSAAHTAFAGNFNKAVTIVLSVCLGVERLPEGGFWSSIMIASVVGSIGAFTAYSMMTSADATGKEAGKHSKQIQKLGETGQQLPSEAENN